MIPAFKMFFQLLLNSCFQCKVNGSLFFPNWFYALLDRNNMMYKRGIKTMKILIRPSKNILKFTKQLTNFNFSSSEYWAPFLTFFVDSGVPMFKEMVSPTFLVKSSSLCFYLLPTSIDENKLSRGVKPLGILLSSIDIISLGL
jgi:hypothetical protein